MATSPSPIVPAEHLIVVAMHLTTLQRAPRNAEDGLPHVSTYAILQVLHQAGYTWQQDRTWCDTGTVERKRKDGMVKVTDPHAAQKRGRSSRRTL